MRAWLGLVLLVGVTIGCSQAPASTATQNEGVAAPASTLGEWVLPGPGEGPDGTCGPGNWATIDGTYWQCALIDGQYRWAYDPANAPPNGQGEQPDGADPAGTAAAASDPDYGTRPGETLEGASKQACINAWRDKEFAREIPQLPIAQDAELTDRIWEHCHRFWGQYMSRDERQRAYEVMFAEVGQVAADAISAYSNKRNVPICEALFEVLKPVFDPDFGLMGWSEKGLLPILYRQWQGGPMVGKLATSCNEDRVLMQFRRHYNGSHEGPYYPPRGTEDANWVLTQEQMDLSRVNAGVCIVWSPRLGNTRIGAPAEVVGYTTVYNADPVNFVKANFEVITCELNAAVAAGLPVLWAPSPSIDDQRTVTKEYAGTWHTMEEDCSWRLTPRGGGAPVTWRPEDGPYMVVELRAGDEFASTCQFQKNEWEHMLAAPDGVFPVGSLAPGEFTPLYPQTCRYAMVGKEALRSPPPHSDLKAYKGEVLDLYSLRGTDMNEQFLRAVGCGNWKPRVSR